MLAKDVFEIRSLKMLLFSCKSVNPTYASIKKINENQWSLRVYILFRNTFGDVALKFSILVNLTLVTRLYKLKRE